MDISNVPLLSISDKKEFFIGIELRIVYQCMYLPNAGLPRDKMLHNDNPPFTAKAYKVETQLAQPDYAKSGPALARLVA